MNHYKARQKEVSKLWHYTCANDDFIYPVGYCADNCPGHATEQEAKDHYKEYLLDNVQIITPDDKKLWPKYKCDVKECNNQGDHSVNFRGYSYHNLCKDHTNRAILSTLVEVHESWGS